VAGAPRPPAAPSHRAPSYFCRAAASFLLLQGGVTLQNCCITQEDRAVPDTKKPLLIKRYASRRLYNTETSDYVTLEDIAGFIREGREVQIVDLKSGDDLTRQYLLQIIAEHESRGETMLPVNILTDLVRSYTTQAQSVVPHFLQMSFDMLRDGQHKMVESMNKVNPLSRMPGFEAMQAQQEAFVKAMMANLPKAGWPMTATTTAPEPKDDDGLDAIKRQLAELQVKLSKMDK
jgi:polyhydroxyalkanoate synthesis repressor PhaR